MSYAFNVRAPTKDGAIAAVVAKLDEVVAGQPIHARDRDVALAVATTFVDLLTDDPMHHVAVAVSGSLGWRDDQSNISSANVSVNVALVPVVN